MTDLTPEELYKFLSFAQRLDNPDELKELLPILSRIKAQDFDSILIGPPDWWDHSTDSWDSEDFVTKVAIKESKGIPLSIALDEALEDMDYEAAFDDSMEDD